MLTGATCSAWRSPAKRRGQGRRGPALGGGGVWGGWRLRPPFRIEQLVEPQPVIVRAADSTEVHLQLFLPPPGGLADAGRRPAIMFFHGGHVPPELFPLHTRP